jgi:hypothetical protein
VLTNMQRQRLVYQLAWFLKQLPAPPLEEVVRKTAVGMQSHLRTCEMDPENSLLGLKPSLAVLNAAGVERNHALLEAYTRGEPLLGKRRSSRHSSSTGVVGSQPGTVTDMQARVSGSAFLAKNCIVMVPFRRKVSGIEVKVRCCVCIYKCVCVFVS